MVFLFYTIFLLKIYKKIIVRYTLHSFLFCFFSLFSSGALKRLFLLVDDFDGEFDLVGFFVGIEFNEGLDVAGHACGACFSSVLKA